MQKIIDKTKLAKLAKLVTLMNFLDDLPHRKFYMPGWSSADRTRKSCGTAGCACGWAATIFAKEGWSFDSEGFPRIKSRVWTYSDVQAFAFFFGITYSESFWITCDLDDEILELSPSNKARIRKLGFSYAVEHSLLLIEDITPHMAADRIRKIVAKYDPSLLEEKKTVGTLVDVLA